MENNNTNSKVKFDADAFAEEKAKIEQAQAEAGDTKKAKPDPEEVQETEIVIYGKSMIEGVAIRSQHVTEATEEYPIVLLIGDDFVPVKPGEEIKTPYDAVLAMDDFQKIGPMIRVIKAVEPMTNVEAI